jgi:hypothetical protein
MCEKATITFYNIIRLDFNKILKICRKTGAWRCLLRGKQAFFPESYGSVGDLFCRG